MLGRRKLNYMTHLQKDITFYMVHPQTLEKSYNTIQCKKSGIKTWVKPPKVKRTYPLCISANRIAEGGSGKNLQGLDIPLLRT